MNRYLLFFKMLLLDGKIPFFSLVQKTVLFAAFSLLVFTFFNPLDYKDMGGLSWNTLLFLLLLRPLSQIFLDFKIFQSLLSLRKEVGIFCGSAAIAHFWGFLEAENFSFPEVFRHTFFWDIFDFYFWGLIAFPLLLLLTFTSSIVAMRVLKKNWKRLHRLVYPLFFFISIHIVLIKMTYEPFFSFEVLGALFPTFLVSLVWFLAWKKISFRFF